MIPLHHLSASHKLETAADAIHGYLHHHYDNGYGSHQLEEAAAEMHHALHEWQHGELSESDINAMADDLRTVWNDFRQAIIPAGLLSAGDMELEALYADIKLSYKHLRFLLRKAK